MKVALTLWEERISPVFDVAGRVRIVELGDATPGEAQWLELPPDEAADRIGCIAEAGATTLICGAISRRLERFAQEQGLRVIPFISGEVGEVLDAFRQGRLDDPAFAMPGCCGRRRRGQRRGAGCRTGGRRGRQEP